MAASIIMAANTCLFAAAPPAAAPSVPKIGFNERGLSSIQYGGAEFLAGSSLVVSNVTFRGYPPANFVPQKDSFDATKQIRALEFEWGRVTCAYQQKGSQLNMTVTVQSKDQRRIGGISGELVQIRFPAVPAGKNWQDGNVATLSVDDVAAIVADYGTGTLAAWNASVENSLSLGFARVNAKDPGVFALRFDTAPSKNENDDAPIKKDESRTYEFAINFGQAGAQLADIALEPYTKFAAAHPFILKWTDHRPIGMVILSSAAPEQKSATNPRGWLSDPKLDVFSPSGKADFKKRMIANAAQTVNNCKKMNAQGVIVWDIEGSEFPHATTYIGDPRTVPERAPEMDEIADQIFKVFTDAGLKVGVTLRPSIIVKNDDPNARIPIKHGHMGFDVSAEIGKKIDYAKQRWGATIFYLDSNATFGFKRDGTGVDSWTMRADLLRKVVEEHPDILLCPEHGRFAYYAFCVPYQELRSSSGVFGNKARTSPRVYLSYPGAFSLENIGDGDLIQRRDELISGAQHGDVFLFRSWFWSKENDLVKDIVQKAPAPQTR